MNLNNCINNDTPGENPTQKGNPFGLWPTEKREKAKDRERDREQRRRIN